MSDTFIHSQRTTNNNVLLLSTILNMVGYPLSIAKKCSDFFRKGL